MHQQYTRNEVCRLAATWTPINENHAIAAMAVYIRFAQSLPDLTLRRGLNTLGPALDDLGFKGFMQARQVQLRVDQQMALAPPKLIEAAGKIFSRHGDGPADEIVPAVEQLQFDADSLLYRTTDYISWSWHFERVRRMLEPVVDQLSGTVIFERIGVEYLDRFRTDLSDPAPLDDLLQRSSPLIASHIFDAPDVFHSHSGAYLNDDPQDLELRSVKVDAVDEDTGYRWVNITTTWEHRYGPEAEQNADPLIVMDEAHTNLKELLATLITPVQAKKIYLLGNRDVSRQH